MLQPILGVMKTKRGSLSETR